MASRAHSGCLGCPGLLFGVTSSDPVTFAGAALLLMATAILLQDLRYATTVPLRPCASRIFAPQRRAHRRA